MTFVILVSDRKLIVPFWRVYVFKRRTERVIVRTSFSFLFRCCTCLKNYGIEQKQLRMVKRNNEDDLLLPSFDKLCFEVSNFMKFLAQ